MCIWKGWSVHSWGEGGCVYMEGVDCVCMRERMCVYRRGGVSMHRRGCVYMEVVDCTCTGRGRMKGWSVRAWGEGCTHSPPLPYTHIIPLSMHFHIHTSSPHALTLHPFHIHTSSPCACTLHPFHIHTSWGEDLCIWKGWSVSAWGEG